MTDHCTTDFCIWRTICLVSVQCISSIRHMYMTDFAYDGPIFLVPLSPSYPSSPVHMTDMRYDLFDVQFLMTVATFQQDLFILYGSQLYLSKQLLQIFRFICMSSMFSSFNAFDFSCKAQTIFGLKSAEFSSNHYNTLRWQLQQRVGNQLRAMKVSLTNDILVVTLDKACTKKCYIQTHCLFPCDNMSRI